MKYLQELYLADLLFLMFSQIWQTDLEYTLIHEHVHAYTSIIAFMNMMEPRTCQSVPFLLLCTRTSHRLFPMRQSLLLSGLTLPQHLLPLPLSQ